MTIQKGKIYERFFSRRVHRVRREKNVTRKNIHWIAVSRVTNVPALRNTFHSVYQLQGSAAAEHPTERRQLQNKTANFQQHFLKVWP